MWRPETNAEKHKRENPAPRDISKPKSEPTIIPEGDGGCCDTLLNLVEYLVCCCGCCTSYDEYHGHSDPSQIDWDSIHAENS